MDLSISLITPEIMRELGADDFDRGRGVDEHGMNPGAPAIKDWQYGWHQRLVERSQAIEQQLAECPP